MSQNDTIPPPLPDPSDENFEEEQAEAMRKIRARIETARQVVQEIKERM